MNEFILLCCCIENHVILFVSQTKILKTLIPIKFGLAINSYQLIIKIFNRISLAASLPQAGERDTSDHPHYLTRQSSRWTQNF